MLKNPEVCQTSLPDRQIQGGQMKMYAQTLNRTNVKNDKARLA